MKVRGRKLENVCGLLGNAKMQYKLNIRKVFELKISYWLIINITFNVIDPEVEGFSIFERMQHSYEFKFM